MRHASTVGSMFEMQTPGGTRLKAGVEIENPSAYRRLMDKSILAAADRAVVRMTPGKTIKNKMFVISWEAHTR